MSTDQTLNPAPDVLATVTPRELRIVFAGLLLALALAALDQNIVSPALPQIVGDLGGMEHYSWVITAFLLTSTATAPLYGKLSDMFGRKPLFLIAITIFLLGSILCGQAHTMTQLIVFRGVQGLGAGGLITLAQTTVADMVAPRERGKYQGLIAGVFGICSVAGPLLGGYLTENFSWRWIFYVNIPIGLVALFLIAGNLKRHTRAVFHQIDYLGAALLTVGTTCLLFLLSVAGDHKTFHNHAERTAVLAGLAAASTLSWAALFWQERRAAEPILPPRLFNNPIFIRAAGVMALTFMAMLGSTAFISLYFQLVLSASPKTAGLMMVPMMAGVITASIVGGRFASKTGNYKILPVVGLAFATAGFLAIAAAMTWPWRTAVIECSLVILGAGIGLVMPNLTVAIQNGVGRGDLGAATAASSFFRSLGGSLGVALCGALVTSQLHTFLPEMFTVIGDDGRSLLDQGADQIHQMPPEQQQLLIAAYRHAIRATFLAGGCLTAAAFVLAIFVPAIPVHVAPPKEEPPADMGIVD
jgi:EmrB/QacA subfamily drug resistance transporter